MKTFLTLLASVTAGLLYAAGMGVYDRDSRSWHVGGKNFACTFFEGHMFPSRFSLGEGRDLPRETFQDSIRVPGEKGFYRLNLDRWARLKVIKNTPEEFIAELTGKFCRTAAPHMEELDGVTAVYRYRFTAEKPGFFMSCRLVRAPEMKTKLRVMRTLAPSWYLPGLFQRVKTFPDGKGEALDARSVVDRSRKEKVVFDGKPFSVTVCAKRVILTPLPADSRARTLLCAGFWDTDWEGGDLSVEAEMEFGRGK